MFLLVLGAMYGVCSLVFVGSVCAAAAVSPPSPPEFGGSAQELRSTDGDGLGRVYSLTARR